MQTVEFSRCRGMGTRVVSWALMSCALVLGTGGCGPVEEPPAEPVSPGVRGQELESDNALSINGLSFNGLSFNGLSFNGLSFNGLSSSAFKSWFQSNPARADEVMRYVVRCAVPVGQTRSFTDTVTGRRYTWPGSLGLAPVWSTGAAAPVAEQQLVSACLAAHVNAFGVSVPISLVGRNAVGGVLAYTPDELNGFPKEESCFFGNLFTGQGIFAGSRGTLLSQNTSSSRACAVVDNSGSQRMNCSPLVYVGDCSRHCSLDPLGLFYADCDYSGNHFRPLTTRLRGQDIYRCGDGTCQVTESCGNANWYNSCQADCGVCK
ncbi:hypothetical protein JY651_13305 [Pyxidicoccus parkwayensis]|uniref:Lipoprotein n=1 Tax=Pyxidicoccus parkwayensis TaxID=2813578 RepID=A0ABX7P5W2_9BACT|nr:hypothetical protein [Pyxidicoccus parkwaysis]QSQ25841.1 hypothetical protein JY651_13305 [Pyxidicoccus parkwaysis]